MKKVIIDQKNLKYGSSPLGADLLSGTDESNTENYNTAQLIDNLNIPFSPLVDVKTSVYEDIDTKTPVNVLYNIDSSLMPSAALENVIVDVSTHADNTVHVETATIDNLYYRLFNITVLPNTKGFKYGVSDTSITSANINIDTASSCKFTYNLGNPSIFNKCTVNPSDQYIWIAIAQSELISTNDINADGVLSVDASYFIEAGGFSGNDSPQPIEFGNITTTKTSPNDGTLWRVFMSDSKFGVAGLDYNIIVKPGLEFFTSL